MTANEAHVRAVAEATRWEKHGVRYGDDDCLDCICGWTATGKPDRADLYREHVAAVAVATLTPLIAAEVRAEADDLRELVKNLDRLLAAYRTGGRPPGVVLDRIRVLKARIATEEAP